MPTPSATPLPLTFAVPARHVRRRNAITWTYVVLAIVWIAVGVFALASGISLDPLTVLPPTGLLLVTLGVLLVLPRLRPQPVASLRVEPARLVTEDRRGTYRFPAHKVRAALALDHGDLVLILDTDERPRPPEPVRVVLARHGVFDPRVAALAGVLNASKDSHTQRVVSELGGVPEKARSDA